MADEDWKVNAEKVDELFNNKYFQNHLQESVRRYLAGRVAAAFAVLALFGISGGYLWHWVHGRVADLTTQYAAAEKELQRAPLEAKQAVTDATNAAAEAKKDLSTAMSAASLADLARQPLQAAAQSLGKDISDLSSKQQTIAKTEDGLKATADKLQTTATALDAEVKTVKDQEQELQAVHDLAQDDEQQLGEVKTKTSVAAASLESLETSTEDVSRFKTFEFTTLLRNSTVDLTIPYAQKDAQTKNLNTVYYHLSFVTRAIKRPMDLTINVLAPGGDQFSLMYKDQNVKRGDPQRTSSCICGTPFMFQMDNIQIPLLLRNYATLKVLGRSSKTECELPAGKTKAMCP